MNWLSSAFDIGTTNSFLDPRITGLKQHNFEYPSVRARRISPPLDNPTSKPGILDVRVVNPNTLSSADFRAINEVTQDMWAHGIGELAFCSSCSTMHSKKDIFWTLKKETYQEKVADIMRGMKIDTIDCPHCHNETNLIFGERNEENIRERLLKSQSLLVLCRDENGEIVGYMDAYVDTLETIYRREFQYHYSEIGFQTIKDRVSNTLWYTPSELLNISSVGLVEKYTNFFSIFQMMQELFKMADLSGIDVPGITELDANNNFYGLFQVMGCESLGIRDSELQKQIQHTGKDYDSDLVVFRNPVEDFNEKFSMGIREFLKLYRSYRKR